MDLITVQSANIDAVGFEPELRQLWVRFRGKETLYVYPEFTAEGFAALLAAPSKGRWIHDYLRMKGIKPQERERKQQQPPPSCDFAIL